MCFHKVIIKIVIYLTVSTDNIKIMSIHSLDKDVFENQSKQRENIKQVKVENIKGKVYS